MLYHFVIVFHPYAIQCLNSIKVNIKVLIIDHSKDLDLDTIIIPKNISLEIIKNENLGNGAGINCGIKNAKTNQKHHKNHQTKQQG